ncbi:GNAT family N-acetyltransferase [Maribacter sp. 2210JD10-5]|uniref:GNAT family N-acetyltransferase n=1 Tax=Maribacter sp. 2210JD10-5 TaxID=3386272 RepID=UPI0039BC7049
MGLNLKILEVFADETHTLKAFIESLDDEQNSFRYFKNRTFEVLKNHLYTCLLLNNDLPIGYGHLDKENAIVWLGIVIKKEYQGKGLAKKIMQSLIKRAEELKLESIHLSVDNDNERAITLYERFGFHLASSAKNHSILKKKLSFSEKDIVLGVSSLAFKGNNREEIVRLAKENNWTIEFSSSFPFQEDMIDFFIKINVIRLAHNYFPAPESPFVINLASRNEEIRQRSIAHCIQGLELSSKCEAPCFSAHAGFCVDPDPNQLGKNLNINIDIDRNLNWKLFLDSIQVILLEAERLNVLFLIENNVTAKFNLRNDGQEVLFCSRAEEMVRLIEEVDSDNFGLLLDTAHLKVSSLALNFNISKAVQTIKPFVKYVHHSDNDGSRDTNDSINEDYWFLSEMNKFKDCIHILEVKNININQIKKQLSLLKTYAN